MKVTVCELTNDWLSSEEAWDGFVTQIRGEGSDLVVLPEMALYRWLSGTREVDPKQWDSAVEAHDYWIGRFEDLAAAIVVGSRPVVRNGNRFNEGFVWHRDIGYRAVHTKYYLPDEEGYWEASWYQRGACSFEATTVAGVNIGMMICTDLWFQVHARAYSKQAVHLLICPRATPDHTTDRWIVGGRAAAIVAGAYCLSSNFNGPNMEGPDFGGTAWIIEPHLGEIIDTTSKEKPFLTRDIDIKEADAAKQTYPRYVQD